MKKVKNGYALPSIIILGLALSILLTAALQSSLSVRRAIATNYFNRIAQLAAEAGNTYAQTCVKQGQVNWSDTAPLKPNTDCAGASAGGSANVFENGTWSSTFSVPSISTRSDGSATYTSTGIVTIAGSGVSYKQVKKLAVGAANFEVSQSASGQERTCSLISNNIYCWGSNEFGQLGNGEIRPKTDPGDGSPYGIYTTPQKVIKEAGALAGKNITKIAAGASHNCALADGEVYCWGRNANAELGQGTMGDEYNSPKPLRVGGALTGKTVTDIGMGNISSYAIAGGKIYSWGFNSGTILGIGGGATRVATPTQVAGTINNYNATALASGARMQSMCAIANNDAWCWGVNNVGQLGINSTSNANVPTMVTKASGALSGKIVSKIFMEGLSTDSHACVIANNLPYCWGGNANGQLGDNTTTNRSVPTPVLLSGALSGKTVTDMSVSGRGMCVLIEGLVYCAGTNNSGELGVNNTSPTQSSTVVAVARLAGGLQNRIVTKLGGGSGRACAIADFRSFCWGNNNAGQIGDGTQNNIRRAPTEATFLRPQSSTVAF